MTVRLLLLLLLLQATTKPRGRQGVDGQQTPHSCLNVFDGIIEKVSFLSCACLCARVDRSFEASV